MPLTEVTLLFNFLFGTASGKFRQLPAGRLPQNASSIYEAPCPFCLRDAINGKEGVRVAGSECRPASL